MFVPPTPALRTGRVHTPAAFDFDRFDALVFHTDGIDRFCSSSVWSESVRKGFMPQAPLVSYHYRDATALFTMLDTPHGLRTLLPLDAVWNLGCPMASSNPRRELRGLLEQIAVDLAQFNVCILSGIRPRSTFYKLLICAISDLQLTMKRYYPAQRCVADLHDGLDAWLSRRSSKFRASLRSAITKAQSANIRFRLVNPVEMKEQLLETMLDIEKRSWKSSENTGLTDPTMQSFCREFIRRGTATQQLCGMLALDHDHPVGYILGAVTQGRYRGGFMSYDNAYRPLGLGNTLQWHMMRRLYENQVFSYDLGSHMAYKTRWADHEDETATLLIGISSHTRLSTPER